MKNTKIEWAHHTVNFWWGCTMATLATGALREECRHCYALLLSKIFGRGRASWGPQGKRWVRHEAARRELYKLDRAAHKRGERERVFINSMSDTFEDREDLNEARGFLWDACQFVTNLDILLLTKRPQNVCRMVPPAWLKNWPAHVWIGTTVGTQAAADEAIPELLKVPAQIRFLSCEPLLGSVDLDHWVFDREAVVERVADKMLLNEEQADAITNHVGIHWVICGGESGPGARPMHPDWARSLRDQCEAADVPFFFKQWGEWLPGEQTKKSGTGYFRCDTGALMSATGRPARQNFGTHEDVNSGRLIALRIGKEAAGRLLDGREWNETPTLEF